MGSFAQMIRGVLSPTAAPSSPREVSQCEAVWARRVDAARGCKGLLLYGRGSCRPVQSMCTHRDG
jgi:hypothetical protein